MKLTRPDALRTTKKDNDHTPPFAMVLVCEDEEFRNFMLAVQTFAVNDKLAFNVVPFDKNIVSWVIVNFVGDAVEEGNEKEALAAIKLKVWGAKSYRLLVTEKYAAAGLYGTTSEHVLDSTKSWRLTFVENYREDGTPRHVFQLTGKPWNGVTAADQARLRKTIKELEIFCEVSEWRRDRNGLTVMARQGSKLDVDKAFQSCRWCKAETHPAPMCPLPKIDGWLGPVPLKSDVRPVNDINDLRNIRLEGVVTSKARDTAPRASGSQVSASSSRENGESARDKRKGWEKARRGGKRGGRP